MKQVFRVIKLCEEFQVRFFQGRKIDNPIVQFQIYLRRSKKKYLINHQLFPIINKITRHMWLFIKIRYSNCGRVPCI